MANYMKKTLLFLSILFATILLGGCDKETISLVDTKWVDSGDFGGFKYEQYCLTFSTDDKVTLESGTITCEYKYADTCGPVSEKLYHRMVNIQRGVDKDPYGWCMFVNDPK